jgi:hypothetical protein
MIGRVRVLVAGAAVAAFVLAFGSAGAGASSPPLWVLHVQNFDGGISNVVRAHADASVAAARALAAGSALTAPAIALDNVQANADSTPPLPQDETAVAFKPSNPLVAVAAANDFISGSEWIGRTTDGGHTWSSLFKPAAVSGTGDFCFGGDPSVVYSVRDAAFYVSTLCFSLVSGASEVQVYKSVDDGATFTPSNKAALVATNRTANGSFATSIFNDKELLAVDNNPSSSHFGRLYVTFIKFHLVPPSGRSDFCPVQVAFSDNVPTVDPSTSTWTRVAVVPDAPGASGLGPSANQWAEPVVDSNGGLDISYAIEDCNTAIDRGLFFTRSTDGGVHFSPTVQIDKPGQFADNPNAKDLLPAKQFRAPISPQMAFNPVTGALEYVYQNNVDRQLSGADISFQQSLDLGKTWSNAKTISITPSGTPAPNDQFEPAIAVDPNGNLHAIWYDNRNDPGDKLVETFQAFSSNDGASWRNVDISTAAWNPNDSFFTNGSFIGDYTAIAAAASVVYPLWTDARNSPGQPNGETDIFTNVEIGGIP